MVCIVYTEDEPISAALGSAVVNLLERSEIEKEVKILKMSGSLVHEENLDDIKSDLLIFLSCHKARWPAFTIHALGNWADSAIAGGKPQELGMSAPRKMAQMLMCMNECNNTGIKLVYEATHHGPLLETPSFFVEVGGSDEIGPIHYNVIANAVRKYVERRLESQGKVAIGIGGTHYPEKFTKFSLEGKYAFSHILPKYYCAKVDMLEKAAARSTPRAECALIDWKGVGPADQRDKIIRKLDGMGLEYVRV